MAPAKAGKSVHSARYRLVLNRLRAARKAAGLTQAQVAARLGQPQSFVSKVESGERRLDIIELEQLAQAYGKQLAFFLDKTTTAGVSRSRSRQHRVPRAKGNG